MSGAHRDGRFSGPRGQSLYYQYWIPQQEPRAVLLVVHGAGEHSSRYRDLATFFNARGYVVAALDNIGHGKSDGDYGHVERFDDYLDSLATFRDKVAGDFAKLPLILLGHSMGGLISAAFLIERSQAFAGCALSGPAITSELQPGALQIAFIQLLSRLLPRLGVMQLEADGISRDAAVVEAYTRDPLVNHGKYSARFVRELFATMGKVQSGAEGISLPLLLMHGEADSMTAPGGSRLLYDKAASGSKTLKMYPGLYHEIFNEPEREQVLNDLLAWCEERLAEGSATAG